MATERDGFVQTVESILSDLRSKKASSVELNGPKFVSWARVLLAGPATLKGTSLKFKEPEIKNGPHLVIKNPGLLTVSINDAQALVRVSRMEGEVKVKAGFVDPKIADLKLESLQLALSNSREAPGQLTVGSIEVVPNVVMGQNVGELMDGQIGGIKVMARLYSVLSEQFGANGVRLLPLEKNGLIMNITDHNTVAVRRLIPVKYPTVG
ncbi:MAG: hypothetical protein UU93_C0010G0027 [Candidatus Amesbacteria bacterium GW2011_GWA2_42_12]|uniref:Uncharacterized protein n=1 Tax=Candidatus Amesbacteria bacterium GW2011_GWA2_42_12 TaxID=1618356 RepID=A0A0G1B3N5_9BACT|nr:MAG: hypothetical protein UU93_C0010G0027 [Candidatus Amesbacteria bacterium GW2011_GWA2_42_12]